MNDKYFKLQKILVDTFELDSPIEIEKGVLLLDTTTRKVILNLKLNVLEASVSTISSITLDIECRNDAGELSTQQNPMKFTFFDIFLLHSKSFDEQEPIVLDTKVRRVNIKIARVVFLDGSVWNPPKEGITMPPIKVISSLNPALAEQFNRNMNEIVADSQRDQFIFIPQQLNKYWICTCGRPNNDNVVDCRRCGLPKELVFNLTDEAVLKKSLDEFTENLRLEVEKIRLIAEEEARKSEQVAIRKMQTEKTLKKRKR